MERTGKTFSTKHKSLKMWNMLTVIVIPENPEDLGMHADIRDLGAS